jgi:hypothetical protein
MLPQFIREFTIQPDSNESSAMPNWITTDQILPLLLPMLPSIKKLSMTSNIESFVVSADLQYHDWNHFPVNLNASLVQLLSSNTLVEIYLSHFKNIPPTFLAQSPQLKRLTLHVVAMNPQPQHDLPIVASAPIKGQLETLELQGDGVHSPIQDGHLFVEALQHPNSALGISSLRELLCEVGTNDVEAITMVAAIVQAAARSLELWSVKSFEIEGMLHGLQLYNLPGLNG